MITLNNIKNMNSYNRLSQNSMFHKQTEISSVREIQKLIINWIVFKGRGVIKSSMTLRN